MDEEKKNEPKEDNVEKEEDVKAEPKEDDVEKQPEQVEDKSGNEMKGLDDLIDEADAAVRIQSHWRGWMVRKESGLDKQSRAIEKESQRDIPQEVAARRIQSFFKTQKSRKDMKVHELPQSQLMNAFAGEEEIDDPEENAAVVIQRNWKGHYERKQHKKRVTNFHQRKATHAALAIQASFRGFKGRQFARWRKQEVDDMEKEAEELFQSLLWKYNECYEEREDLLGTNRSLQLKLTDYFLGKKGEESKEDLAPGITADLQQRYRSYLSQYSNLRTEYEKLKDDYDRVSSELETRLEEREEKAIQFRDSFVQFKREIITAAENSRTGRPIPAKVIQKLEAEEMKRDKDIAEARLKHITYRNRLRSLEHHLKQKEELAEGLHLIDFEQLKIENQALNEKIEERNEELGKLKKKITTTVHILTHVKEKLQFVQELNLELKKELAEQELHVTERRDMLNKMKKEKEALMVENASMQDAMPLLASESLLLDYENRIRTAEEVKSEIEESKQRWGSINEEVSRIQTEN